MPNARGQGEQLRGRLVDTASAMLTETRAVAIPSLRAVARACGVSPAAVYLHFASQAQLIDAVIDDQLAAFGASVLGTPASGTPRERLTTFARAYADWGLRHPGAYQLLFESADRLETSTDHGVDGPRWAMLHAATALLADAGAADPASGAFRLWSGLHGLVSLRLHKPGLPWPTPLDDDLVALVRRAIEAS